MNSSAHRSPAPSNRSSLRFRWFLPAGWLLVILLAVLLPLVKEKDQSTVAPAGSPSQPVNANAQGSRRIRQPLRRDGIAAPAPAAEEIVASKLVQFTRNRRDIVHARAKQANFKVPKEVDQFFEALEANR